MSKPKWPETVPFLLPEHMHIGGLRKKGDNNCHCLIAWVDVVFCYAPPSFQFSDAAVLARATIRDVAGTESIPDFNDTHTPAENAAVWNKAMADLGYTEDV